MPSDNPAIALPRAAARPTIRYRRAADRRSRARRWYEAVAELVILQSQYAQWFEALPENLQEGATGEACKRSSISTSTNLIAVVRPRGFGRD